MGQHEAIVAGTPVVSRDVDAFMDTSTIVVVLALIHVWKVAKMQVINLYPVWAAECSQSLPGYVFHPRYYILYLPLWWKEKKRSIINQLAKAAKTATILSLLSWPDANQERMCTNDNWQPAYTEIMSMKSSLLKVSSRFLMMLWEDEA